MKIAIKSLEYHLPKKILTNHDLVKENPCWGLKRIKTNAGVDSRFMAEEGETALDLSLKACQKLFDANEGLKEKLDGLLYCTQSPDYIMPPNGCILHGLFGLPEDVFSVDYNLGCSGYVYGLALAKSIILGQSLKNVVLITADTYSKFVHPRDRASKVLFGDSATATWIAPSGSSEGIVDIICGTVGKEYDAAMIDAGGCRLPKSPETSEKVVINKHLIRTQENFYMNGKRVLQFVETKVADNITSTLAKNKLTKNDIDIFIFHQASKMAIDCLSNTLKLKSNQVFSNIEYVGNTVSSSIPIALKDALSQDVVKPGHKVVLCGFGVGLSLGTAIINF